MTTMRTPTGTTLELDVRGNGPTMLLPVDSTTSTGPMADELRKWGVDPELGTKLADGLAEHCRVVSFGYENQVMANPKPDTLTQETVATDLLAVADEVGAQRFGYYGYSWLALAGLHLALRTDRVAALAMGGFPPIDGPYEQMLKITTATHAMAVANESNGQPQPTTPDANTSEFDWSAVQVTITGDQTKQFETLYQALQGFDDRAAQRELSCPRLCFAGSADVIDYGERWGGVEVSIGPTIAETRQELEDLGWHVEILDGLDHTQAMQPQHVLPVLKPWLAANLR